MSKERLEKIGKYARHKVLENSEGKVRYRITEINTEDFDWLVERVQELEEELIVQKECFEELQNNHIRVCNQIKRYREALEKIARINIEQGTVTVSEVHAILTARQALEG